MKSRPEFKNRLWIMYYRFKGKNRGFDIGNTQSCVTPVYLKGSIPEAMVLVKDLENMNILFYSGYQLFPKDSFC